MTKAQDPSITWTLAQVNQLPDYEELSTVVCPIVVTKDVSGSKIRFLIEVSEEGERLIGPISTDSLRTQPSQGFQEIEPWAWSTVYDSIVMSFREFVFHLNEAHYTITALGAMASYFKEVFNAFPYFDFLAGEINCGKSTALKALVLSSRYGKVVSSTSAASLYRDRWKGTPGIDELDNQLVDKENRAILLSILDSGYARGYPAERVNPDTREVEYFDAFGLKAFSRVGDIPQSIISRSITINMIRSPKSLSDIDDFDPFIEVRDQMYRKMLFQQEEVRESYHWVRDNCELFGRDRQLFAPLLSIARLVSKEVYRDTLAFAHEYIEQRRGIYDDVVIKTLVEVLLRPQYLGYEVPTVNIRDDLHDLLVERGVFSNEARKIGSRRVNTMLDSLYLKRSSKRNQGYVHYTIDRNMVIRWACDVYDLLEVPPDTSLTSLISPEEEEVTPKSEVSEISEIKGDMEKPTEQSTRNPKEWAKAVLAKFDPELPQSWTLAELRDEFPDNEYSVDEAIYTLLQEGFLIEVSPDHYRRVV